MGLLEADAGSISGMPDKMTAVFQENRLLEEFSAVENIQLACSNYVEEKDIINALKEVGFTENHIPANRISGGMATLCCCQSLYSRTELIILDEPLTNWIRIIRIM